MRAKQFDELPGEVKELLQKTIIQAEAYNYYATRDLYLSRWKEMVRDSGKLKVLQFTPKEGKEFLEKAWDAKMEELVVKASAEFGKPLKEILESIKDKQVEPPVR